MGMLTGRRVNKVKAFFFFNGNAIELQLLSSGSGILSKLCRAQHVHLPSPFSSFIFSLQECVLEWEGPQ